jgi:hypothetical protein
MFEIRLTAETAELIAAETSQGINIDRSADSAACILSASPAVKTVQTHRHLYKARHMDSSKAAAKNANIGGAEKIKNTEGLILLHFSLPPSLLRWSMNQELAVN